MSSILRKKRRQFYGLYFYISALMISLRFTIHANYKLIISINRLADGPSRFKSKDTSTIFFITFFVFFFTKGL